MRPTFYRISAREIALIAVPVLLLVGGAIWLMLNYMQPAPPTRIVLSTGGQSGAYYAFAKRYEKVLDRAGIKLDIKTSAGSIENLKRLQDERSGVDAAFLQGGIASTKTAPTLQSVGRLFHEPLWIFYRGNETLDRLSQLAGKRLAIGPEGSGTRQLALQVLEPSGVSAASATFLPLGGAEATKALEEGAADVLFTVAAPEAPQVQSLLRAPGVRVLSLAQAEAYVRLFPFLTRLVLPQGVVDLVRNIPAADVVLLAPAAVLVVREDMHPALASLLAQAASDVHQSPSLFARASEFPKAVDPEFAVADSAARFYKNGPPFLQRYLPFWLANFVERMIVLGVAAGDHRLAIVQVPAVALSLARTATHAALVCGAEIGGVAARLAALAQSGHHPDAGSRGDRGRGQRQSRAARIFRAILQSALTHRSGPATPDDARWRTLLSRAISITPSAAPSYGRPARRGARRASDSWRAPARATVPGPNRRRCASMFALSHTWGGAGFSAIGRYMPSKRAQ